MRRFVNRKEAGERLAKRLEAVLRGRRNLLVLALPRGGVPVACEVAKRLHAPLDVLIVRKLGLPGHEELAMGAVTSAGDVLLNEDLVRRLAVPKEAIQRVVDEEWREACRREQVYREGRPPLDVHDRTVILVDDGLATGSTMLAAVRSLAHRDPHHLIVAVPVAPATTLDLVGEAADEVVCLESPEPFLSVGTWYDDFQQTRDEDVVAALNRPF